MKHLSFRFMLLAVIGSLLNFIIHFKVILSPLFTALPIYKFSMTILGIGVFIVCIPAIFALDELIEKSGKRKDVWKVAFQAFPLWIKCLIWVIIFYGFIVGGMQSYTRLPHSINSQVWLFGKEQIESGQYLPFYCVAAAVLYTRWRT